MPTKLALHGHTGLPRLAGLLLCALFALSACERAPEVRYAPSLEPNTLLQLRFAAPAEAQEIDLGPLEEDKSRAKKNVVRAVVKPLRVVKFDEAHATLLTRLDTGENCHACPGVMGAYFYEHDEKGWRLTKSQDALLSYGGNGGLGKLAVAPLERDHHAATLEWGSCWQGTCGMWLMVVSLRPGAAQPIEGNLALGIDNDGMHDACSALDRKPDQKPKEEQEELTAEQQVCHQIQSRWQWEGPRLLVDYTGRLREVEGKVLQAPRNIK